MKGYDFYQTLFFLFTKFINELYLLENLNNLKSFEQIKGAKKPVRKTSAKIFWALGKKSVKVPSEKFLNKICMK